VNYENLSLEELEKDIFYSKKMLPFLSGYIYKSYEEWIIKKEERVKLLKNKEKDENKNF
jgi:hypothetical protein